MINLALSAANQAKFNRLIVNNHIVYPTVHILNLNHARISDVSRWFADGQITIDADAEVTRSLSMTLYDPGHTLALDTNSPSDGALFLDRMLAVWLSVIDPYSTTTYTVPVFCGPLTKLDRDWVYISVEAQGKESFGMKEAWLPRTYTKGAYKTDVIRSILSYYLGEYSTKMSIPSLTYRLPSNLSISMESKPWAVAKSLARGMGYQLFYDGRGICVMRKWPVRTGWTFSEGANGSVLSKPQVGQDLDNLVNAAYVKGAVPKGKKTPIIVKKTAASTHPLSPTALGRGGKGRYYWAKIEDDKIGSLAEANAVATAAINKGLMISTSVAFDSLVIPHLEEYDITTVSTAEFAGTFPLRKYTIPLLASGKSSVGYIRNSTVNKARIRKAR